MKEHETEFHDNPNYVTVFTLCHGQMVLQPHEVEMSSLTIEEEEDSANFTIAMCHCRAGHAQFLIRLQIIIFYFPYMETNWLDCDGTWQSV